jgi:hypothetical protein
MAVHVGFVVKSEEDGMTKYYQNIVHIKYTSDNV